MKTDQVVVVTGASRGAGKGIALALAETGATVYVTGRSAQEGDAPLPGTVFATAEEINQRGGKGIPVVVDHADDAQVKALFSRIDREQGRLDILVNNAACIPEGLTDKGGFWEKPLGLLDILNVGMRSHYVASYYAAPIMVRQRSGLIVHTSSFGGRCYMHGPAYGAGKAAVDKMANDMAVDLRPYDVACVSIWMGLLRTERTMKVFDAEPEKYAALMEATESPEFTGRVIAALAKDPALMQKSGKILVGAELAQEYGVTDIDGRQPASHAPMLGAPAQANPAVVE
ncbi:MAG: SDR family NAD(P)-dependent oxidoreductase [Gammaproteobacteria bacterium]|nr:MAG: SDR family NAD(P)-dependent oxidoreductase [Gammaproteobacteria bacterium]